MGVLVLAEKKGDAQSIVDAFRSKGLAAKYIRLSKVVLVSRQGKTLIKIVDDKIENYDEVCLIASSSLAPFVEPLIEELASQGYYVNVKPGSFYLGQNIPLMFVTLAMEGVPSPRTLVAGSGKNIERVSKKISYPLLAKSFVGKNVQQSLVVNNIRELNSFVNSIKQEVDGFMLREYSDSDLISCAVVGNHVFAMKRKIVDGAPVSLDKGVTYKLTDSDKESVLLAARVCGYDLAKVDISKGQVISVKPRIPFKEFNYISSENIESFVVDHYIEQLKYIERKSILTELKGIKSILSKTIFGRVFR